MVVVVEVVVVAVAVAVGVVVVVVVVVVRGILQVVLDELKGPFTIASNMLA